MKNTALRPGYAVQVLPTKYDAQIEMDSINAALDKLEKTAYSAGFVESLS